MVIERSFHCRHQGAGMAALGSRLGRQTTRNRDPSGEAEDFLAWPAQRYQAVLVPDLPPWAPLVRPRSGAKRHSGGAARMHQQHSLPLAKLRLTGE
jgi:hypothetical protein